MNDLISRKEAIDAVEHITSSMSVCVNTDECHGMKRMQRQAVIELANLPSEQPEPCEDAVSRKAVEEMLKNGFPARGMWEIEGDVVKQTVCETLADALMDLERLPSAQPERWIPVSEMLPEEDTDVLISYRYKEGEGDTSHVYIGITSYGDMFFGGRKVKGAKHWRPPFEYFTSNYEVIAWMPLPEPWREEE